MKRRDLEKLKRELEAEKRELTQQIGQFSTQLEEPLSSSTDELSLYDNHPADLGSETFERSKDLALRHNAKNQLAKVEEALAKIEDGTYGICEVCGREIPLERLEAIPSTTLCLECRKATTLKDRHPRPIEEDVIMPPFGGLIQEEARFEPGDPEGEIMFDGEDTWQAVARYGTAETPQDLPNVPAYPDMYADADEDIGYVDDVDAIPYEIEPDGVIYQDFDGEDDELIHTQEKIRRE